MKTRLVLLCSALASSLLLPAAQAQVSFYGSDDFNDNTPASGRWQNGGTSNTAAWTETNGRLEFTANASSTAIINTNRAASFTLWANDTTGNTSYTDSWGATMSFTIDKTAVATNGASWLGLEVSQAAGGGGYYGIYFTVASSGGRIFTEQGIGDGLGGYTRTILGSTGNLDPAFDSTDVLFRISYNASTTALTSSFSFDSGATYYTYGTWSGVGHYGASATGLASNWIPAPTSGFGLELYGALYGDGVNPGPSFISGQAYADNLSVSAIPEPSTYAALAGLSALGLACWRRRRRALPAS